MKRETLIDAAGLVADGEEFDLASISSVLSSDEERGIADELVVVARIAAAHRKLHQVLPADAPAVDRAPFAASWGHLDLIEVVGRGSYGTVYRAWDPRLDRLVALKLFHGARNPEAVMREGRMLARMRHENVVTVYGADVYNGIAGIWMEFVHGRRLDQIVEQQGPLSAEEATLVGLAVCRALGAVHGAGLLHCDVKAQNVIREPGGRIVLMDLGAGRSTVPDDDSTSKLQVAGTPRYMAPEVFDQGDALPQSDVYSVGVLLFYLASGRFPVDGRTLSDIRKAHLVGQRVLLNDVRADLPAEFVRDVTRALDPKPAARHATPGEFEAGLLGVRVTGTEPVPVSHRRGIQWIAAAALLAATLLAGLGWRFGRETAPLTALGGTRSIAVLPFKNLTGDSSKAYLADGLTEVLISNLARVKAFRVTSFGAVTGFRDNKETNASVANKLGVELLLAGSLLEVGNRARVVLQLIDPRSDAVVWTDERTPDSSMLLAAQGEIARLIAAHLSVGMSSAEDRALRQAALDPRAQDAYLRGRLANEVPQDRAVAEKAVANLALATELEPKFADAWGHRALAELNLIELTAGVDRAERSAHVKQLAERAIQLDPTAVSGYLALGNVQFQHEWNFEAAEQTLREGLGVAPSSSLTLQWLSLVLAARGRFDEAIRLARQAADLEPLQSTRHTSLGIQYYYARDYARAEAEMRRALQITPDMAGAHFGLGRIYSATGRTDDAIAELEKAINVLRRPSLVVELARVLIASGKQSRAEPLLAELEARKTQGEGFSLDNYAYLAIARGQTDQAFAILDQAIQERLANVVWIGVDPRVDPLRADPRFARLLAGIGLQR